MKLHTEHLDRSCAAIGRKLAQCIAVAVLWSAASGVVSAQVAPSTCGSLDNAYGPYDYRTDRDKLPIVEGAHFTAPVEMLIRGERGYLSSDIDYTLRAFPNHHRALASMERLAERQKVDRVSGARWDVECYFVRALRFRPDDATVRLLYATYLRKHQRKDEALRQMAVAGELAKDNPFTHYNMGLVYFDLGEHELALASAHRAMALGFPRTELKQKLVAAGKWVEAASAPK